MNAGLTMSRRTLLLSGGAAAGALLLAGIPMRAGAAPLAKITMHRDPHCGCCLKWAEAANAAGFDVAIVAEENLRAFKTRAGVPEALASCHTSLVGPYVVEGHVPFEAVRRLLAEKPDIRGIAVPGMPAGAPGMEMPDGRTQPYSVYQFDSAGKIGGFMKVAGAA